jgi:hypothetical protein
MEGASGGLPCAPSNPIVSLIRHLHFSLAPQRMPGAPSWCAVLFRAIGRGGGWDSTTLNLKPTSSRANEPDQTPEVAMVLRSIGEPALSKSAQANEPNGVKAPGFNPAKKAATQEAFRPGAFAQRMTFTPTQSQPQKQICHPERSAATEASSENCATRRAVEGPPERGIGAKRRWKSKAGRSFVPSACSFNAGAFAQRMTFTRTQSQPQKQICHPERSAATEASSENCAPRRAVEGPPEGESVRSADGNLKREDRSSPPPAASMPEPSLSE